MNWIIILWECLFFMGFFTVFVFVDQKNKENPGSIHNYPEDIQEEYFKTHKRVDVSIHSKKVIARKAVALVVFTLLLTGCALLANAKSFQDGFLFGVLMMVMIGLFDTLFIDWVLFANVKSFRLPGTEHMDEAYHQKWFHFKGLLFPGSIFAIIIGLLVGALVSLFS